MSFHFSSSHYYSPLAVHSIVHYQLNNPFPSSSIRPHDFRSTFSLSLSLSLVSAMAPSLKFYCNLTLYKLKQPQEDKESFISTMQLTSSSVLCKSSLNLESSTPELTMIGVFDAGADNDRSRRAIFPSPSISLFLCL
ncbi:hypothetical protein QN277_016501 [Acacia crassicarpa]|uniref:Uncharacterized protein n=1 Tax=Acacia crassicarpa TaxID=499986 RepID=A0AAE1TAW9_9FABA|nr:hypothetical protein QN277_016501 [Acacia crassicarpa]